MHRPSLETFDLARMPMAKTDTDRAASTFLSRKKTRAQMSVCLHCSRLMCIFASEYIVLEI